AASAPHPALGPGNGPGAGATPVPAALERAPQPDTADLEQLVAQVRGSGLRVSLVRVGQARTLPPGAGLTVYRVCQEALTNVLKHAGPDPTVTVVVRWGATTLDLEVEDDGRGASAGATQTGPQGPGGFGLLGMRERAALFGGTVSVGPRAGGGFRVHLALPVPAAPAAPPVPPPPPPPTRPLAPTDRTP
ncbi:sensor histidine kinase, partial [Cellulosimicrobium cellulans]|uniref:sensor histidine kinase n=1 Tax=Cellulosimicrobium cellulans TaxID=1710 RepID=UPI000A98B8F0